MSNNYILLFDLILEVLIESYSLCFAAPSYLNHCYFCMLVFLREIKVTDSGLSVFAYCFHMHQHPPTVQKHVWY